MLHIHNKQEALNSLEMINQCMYNIIAKRVLL